MKYFFTFLLLFNVCFGQKLQHPVVDKLSGDTSIGTESVTLFRKVGAGRAGEKLDAIVYKSKDETFLALIGRTGKTEAFTFDTGNEVNLKLSDNSVITLKNLKTTSPEVKMSPSFGQYWSTIYLLDTETKVKLINSSVTYIRLNHSTGYFEYDIKDKMSALIGKCVDLVK